MCSISTPHLHDPPLRPFIATIIAAPGPLLPHDHPLLATSTPSFLPHHTIAPPIHIVTALVLIVSSRNHMAHEFLVHRLAFRLVQFCRLDLNGSSFECSCEIVRQEECGPTAMITEEPQVATKSDLQRARSSVSPVLQHSLNWIVNHLTQHQDQILLCKANLEQGNIRDQALLVATEGSQKPAADLMPDFWHKTYTTCKSIPKYFIAHWLISLLIPEEFVDAVDGVYPGFGLRRLFAYFTGLSDSTWWAPAIHVRKVLTAWLKYQFAKMGGEARLKVLKEATSNFKNPDLFFESLHPFEFTFVSTCSPGSEIDSMDRNEDIDTSNMVIKCIRHKIFDVEVASIGLMGAGV